MQPVNHDMDDLMRQAAAGYPVMPQGMDWEKVAQQLSAPGSVEGGKKEHGHLKKLLLLLPLLLAAFVCDRFFVYEHGVLKKWEGTGQAAGTPDKTVAPFTNGGEKKDGTITGFKSAVAVNGREEKNVLLLISKKPGNKLDVVRNNLVSGQVFSPPDMGVLKKSISEKQETDVFPFRKTALLSTTVSKPMPLARVEPLQGLAITQKPLVKSSAEKTRHDGLKNFYVSLLAGPDVSRVKAQKRESPGYSAGVLAGYNITKKWAIEAGLMWDRKNYFSKGDYFKTDHLYLPPHSKVVEVTGYCAMFEVPVNVRYNLIRKKGHALFATAGVSSYLMQREDYNYVYRRYNQEYAGNKVYKKATKNWMSVGNVSMGYEHRIIKGTGLRVEPYIRIPVQGVGIGSLPLRSTGILVGITHPIH